MRYAEYENYTKVYVIVHNTGFGVMEAPYEEEGVVFETDSLEEAQSKSKEFEVANNTKEQIKSSWIPNTYHINVNTLSEGGKKLLGEFNDNFNGRDMSKYDKQEIGGYTFYTQKDS